MPDLPDRPCSPAKLPLFAGARAAFGLTGIPAALNTDNIPKMLLPQMQFEEAKLQLLIFSSLKALTELSMACSTIDFSTKV